MGCRAAVTDLQHKRIARNVSQPGIGAGEPATTGLCEPIGRVAAPTFFWGGEAARATGGFIAARLILMGVWRDSSQPWIEETGVIGNCKRWTKRLKTGGWRRHGVVRSLDLGRLMGVPYLFFIYDFE